MNFRVRRLVGRLALTSVTAFAADYPAPKQGEWIAKDFKFHTGDTMPELRLHYTTVGEPTGQPVLVLHGSGGSAASMLTPAFRRRVVRPRPAAGCLRNTTSSFRTRSATANRQSPLTA